MADILEKIAAYKRAEIAAAKRARPLAEIEREAKAANAPRGFAKAIARRLAAKDYALIAEIKKRELVDIGPSQLSKALRKKTSGGGGHGTR